MTYIRMMKYLILFENFKPKKLKEREIIGQQLMTKKMQKLNHILEIEAETIKKSLKAFKYSDVDYLSLDLFIQYRNLNSIAELANELDKQNTDLEIDQILECYILYLKLKDVIKVGEYFDWKEEDDMRDYIEDHFKNPYEYVYNAVEGTDGWYVIFSTEKLPLIDIID